MQLNGGAARKCACALPEPQTTPSWLNRAKVPKLDCASIRFNFNRKLRYFFHIFAAFNGLLDSVRSAVCWIPNVLVQYVIQCSGLLYSTWVVRLCDLFRSLQHQTMEYFNYTWHEFNLPALTHPSACHWHNTNTINLAATLHFAQQWNWPHCRSTSE